MSEKIYLIKESTLANIGNAIRSATGTSNASSPLEWPELIGKRSQLSMLHVAASWTEIYEVILDNYTVTKVPNSQYGGSSGLANESHTLQAAGILQPTGLNNYYKIYYSRGPFQPNDAYLILETEKNLDNFQVGEEITGKNIRYNRENIRISLQNFSDNEPV